MRSEIKIESAEEKEILKALANKEDAESKRMVRFLKMPDLSRTPESPLHEIVQRVLTWPNFKGFDVIQVPEIVPVSISFDPFDFPADHPARSRSDTYFVDDNNILRTHTTVMWYYYLNDENVKKRMAAGEPLGAFSFGKVYRKDEIDRHHMNVFHQIDGWYLIPKVKKIITIEDLKECLPSNRWLVFNSQGQKNHHY